MTRYMQSSMRTTIGSRRRKSKGIRRGIVTVVRVMVMVIVVPVRGSRKERKEGRRRGKREARNEGKRRERRKAS